MTRVARFALERPRVALLWVGMLTVALAAGLLRLEMRTDGRALRPPDAAYVVSTETDSLRFHDPRQAILLVSARSTDASLASPEGFRFLRELYHELRALPAVRASRILSVASLPRPSLSGGGLSLGTFLDDIPGDARGFASLLASVRAEHLSDGLLLSQDGQRAAFYLPLVENRRVADSIAELEAWADHLAESRFELQLTGPETAEATLGRMVIRDLMVLVPVMLAVIVALLYLVFGNRGGVAIPMAESLVVLIWTFGLMGWLGVPVTLVTTILPVVLMAMAITDEIHLFDRVQAHRSVDPGAAIDVGVERAVAEVATPIIATSVTTALGFMAFVSAEIAPIRQFGVFAAFGIMVAMVLSFVWIPALIVTLSPTWFERRDSGRRSWMIGRSVGRWSSAHPITAIVLGLSVVFLAVPGLTRLEVQDSWVDNFAPQDDVVVADGRYNDSFWGSYRFDVVIEGSPGLFHTARGAALMNDLADIAEDAPDVTASLTYVPLFAGLASSMGQGGEVTSLPRLMITDIATLAEMSESRLLVRQLVTDRGDVARARLFVADADYRRTIRLRDYLDERLPALAARHDVRFHYSGDIPAALAVVGAIVHGQLRSIAWALLTVAVMLVLFFSGLRAALIAMVPVGAAVVVLLGGMGWLGMPLGIATSMFAALTVGVGVDFGVHLVHRYQCELVAGCDHSGALSATVDKTGAAISWNALVLAVGFLVLMLSGLKPNHSLGLLLAAAMVVCYVGAFLFMPRLLRFVTTVVLSCACAMNPATAQARTLCGTMPDPEARALMARLEHDFRRQPRIVRMQIGTVYGERHPLARHFKGEPYEKTLWGIFNGDAEETWLLYTFSAPGRLAGTSLLMRDFADPTTTDSMWLYLRAFDRFSELESAAQRVMVPGTALTYEDSRGFIPLDKYEFSFDAGEHDDKEARLIACPKNADVREDLAYSSLGITLDRAKRVVRHIAYGDLGGKPLKTYELTAEQRLGSGWVPSNVRIVHLADGYTTDIAYEHWALDSPPPQALYEPETDDEKFLTRLERVLREAGLGERIEAEIAAANELIRAYDEKVGKAGGGEAEDGAPRR